MLGLFGKLTKVAATDTVRTVGVAVVGTGIYQAGSYMANRFQNANPPLESSIEEQEQEQAPSSHRPK